MKAKPAYEELVRLARERALLSSCTALLAWDEETYMPRGGAAHRADQLAYLAGLEHEKEPTRASATCWPMWSIPLW